MAFDLLYDRRVEPDAGVEAEVAAVDLAESDRADRLGVDAADEVLDGGDRIVRHAEGACEDVGRTTGEYAERAVGAGDSGRHFVECSVAAVPDHDVDPASGGVVCEARRMSTPVGLDDLDRMASNGAAGQAADTLAESPLDDDGVARRDRRRERVDDQHDPQGGDSNPQCQRVRCAAPGSGDRAGLVQTSHLAELGDGLDRPVTWGSL